MNVLPRYRPDVDGLRGIAVLAVVGYHAFPGAVPGGFVGVDVFFVISGFLISTIIFENLARGRFDYREFYIRRIKRLFPALLAVLAATVLAAHVVSFPDEYRAAGTETFAGAAFVSNLLFLRQGAGYFEPSAELRPLLHLWSLGIEEQFYILWPVTAALLHRRPRLLLPGMAALLAASLAASVAWSSDGSSHAFYSPLSRFWELLAGAALAYAAVFGGERPEWLKRPGTASMLSVMGAMLIAASIAALERGASFPGWRAVLPVAGTVLIIAAGPGAVLNRRILSTKSLVFVGLISYPLYLWHWPLLSFLRMQHGELSEAARIAVVAASILLAWATFRHVEAPIRFRTLGPVRPMHLATAMAGMAALGLLMRAEALPHGVGERAAFVQRFENSQPRYRYIRDQGIEGLYRLDCDFYDFLNARARDAIPPSCVTPARGRSVMIWGDSHAQSLAHGLRSALPADVAVLQVATSACRPDVRPVSPDRFGVCNRSNAFALRAISEAKPDVVLLAQARDHEKTDWSELARIVRGAGVRHVIVAGPLPQWEPDLHKVIARRFWDAPPQRVNGYLQEPAVRSDRLMRERRHVGGDFRFLSLMERLCDAEGCTAYVGPGRVEGLIAFDYGHLTRAGSEYVAMRILVPEIVPLLERRAGAPR